MQHSALLSASLNACKDLQKTSNPLQLACYICSLITASLRLLQAEAQGGAGAQGISSVSPCCRKGSSPPNQMTGPDLAAQQVWLSRHGLICHPLQERTFILKLQTQEHIEDTYHRTFQHESGFALEPPVTGCCACLPSQSQRPCCSAAACTQPIPAVCPTDSKPGSLKSNPRESSCKQQLWTCTEQTKRDVRNWCCQTSSAAFKLNISVSRETTADISNKTYCKVQISKHYRTKSRDNSGVGKKAELECKECFFPVGVWYTEVIPCSSHNPHNLLQEQQNNSVDCKFLSGLQIWKDEKQGEKPPWCHSQKQSHSKDNTVKWTNLKDTCFNSFIKRCHLQELKDTDFLQKSKFNNRCNREIFPSASKKSRAEILQIVAGSLNTIWYKKHPKNHQILKLCLPLSEVRLSLEVYAGKSNWGYLPTATKAAASLLIFWSLQVILFYLNFTVALLAMNFHVQKVFWWKLKDNFQKITVITSLYP